MTTVFPAGKSGVSDAIISIIAFVGQYRLRLQRAATEHPLHPDRSLA